jgi:hypothetical protein
MNAMPQNVSNGAGYLVDRLSSFSEQTSGKHLIGDLLKFLDRTASKHLRKQDREEFVMLIFEQTRLNLLHFGLSPTAQVMHIQYKT